MPAKKPNILFIFTDQQHWQAVGYRDSSFHTPNLDQLAQQSAVFSYAYCSTPQCSPSRSSILTGFYPSKTGVMGNVGAQGGAPLQIPTIAPVLQEAGYRTAYFGKWHLGKNAAAISGWDEDFGVTGAETHDDPEVTRRALNFLGNTAVDQPFALFLSYNNPHDIYKFNQVKSDPPAGNVPLPRSWHEKDHSMTPAAQSEFMSADQGQQIVNLSAPAWQRYRELYREKVQLIDSAIGEVLASLNKQGFSDNTLIVATSDHGDMDTQQRLIYKGPFMYDHTLRVPLSIHMPGQQMGYEVSFPTVNVDLAPTLVDFAGVELPGVDGVSLLPLLKDRRLEPVRPYVIGQYYSKQQWVNPIRTIVRDGLKYNRYLSGEEELYDQMRDPAEIVNVASDPAYADKKAELAELLEDWMEANADPFHQQHRTNLQGQPV